MAKKATKKRVTPVKVNIEPIEEVAFAIATQIATETDNTLSAIYDEWRETVQKLIATHGAGTVRDVFERELVEYEGDPFIGSAFELMKELF